MDERASSWRGDLRHRLRQPPLWAAFGAISLPYTAYVMWETVSMPPLPNPWGWAARLCPPFLLFFACIWLAPIPWAWAWPPGRSRNLWKGALAGLLFSETFVTLRALGGIALKLKAREDPDALGSLLVNLCFLGPAMMLIGGALARREISDRERLTFQRQAEEAQTRLLQSQLHPHVLFNSLNGLAELVLKDPSSAERSIRALSDLLRKLLAASQSHQLPLRTERELVEDYLAMEALRLGDRLEVVWDWDEVMDPLPAIPLLLQPLVENAIKHGIAPSLAGGRVRITARNEGAVARLSVHNSGAPLGPEEGEGLGLANLRARLALAYGDAASLDLAEAEGWTLAEVRIPLEHHD